MYSLGMAYLLWFLGFGTLGLHRFYLGKIPTGILWLCTGGLFALGSIYDFITLPSQVREANFRAGNGQRRSAGQSGGYGGPAQGGGWRYVNDGETRIVGGEDQRGTMES